MVVLNAVKNVLADVSSISHFRIEKRTGTECVKFIEFGHVWLDSDDVVRFQKNRKIRDFSMARGTSVPPNHTEVS